jgi:hypothetical protein
MHVDQLRPPWHDSWPEAHARRREIIAARDAHDEAQKRAAEESGLAAAQVEYNKLSETSSDLRQQIAALSATTMEGLLLKAEVVLWCFNDSRDEVDAIVKDEAWSSEGHDNRASGEFIMTSIGRDLAYLQLARTAGGRHSARGAS